MPKTRREFSPEFKRETVALLETSDRPLMQVATELRIIGTECVGSRSIHGTEIADTLGRRHR